MDRDQIATGEHGLYDAVADTVTLTGHVALTKGKNVTKGERLVYNLATGIATVDAGANGRVSSTFVPSDKAKSGAAPKP
jgi:lipopolysaccharide export system protein LptA